VSIHISQTPFDPFGASFGFGPSFGGRDIREEIARMEQMMDAMMNATMSGFTFNPPRLTATPPPNPFARRMGSTMSFGVSSPSVKNEKDAYVVQLKIPGLDQTQVDAKVEGGMLVVSGIKREELNNQGQGFVSYSSTLSGFHNSFPLPGPVKADGLKVSYDKKKELLTVRIPKKK
jgi:HSP20 family molecular chaperone IbpA